MTLNQKLLSICNAAEVPPASWNAYVAPAGFQETPAIFSAGDLGINAAIVGEIPEGTVVCYRGTLALDDHSVPESQRILDWAGDFHSALSEWGEVPGLCHEGFIGAVDSLAPSIDPLIQKGCVIFTGHSKGGSMAQLAAARYWVEFGKPCHCVTFGAARAGNKVFAGLFEKSGISLTRYQNDPDIVPHVPFEPRLAEILGGAFGVKLPPSDYASAPVLARVHGGSAETIYGALQNYMAEAASIAAIVQRFATAGVKGLRDAHSIEPGSDYWEAVNAVKGVAA